MTLIFLRIENGYRIYWWVERECLKVEKIYQGEENGKMVTFQNCKLEDEKGCLRDSPKVAVEWP